MTAPTLTDPESAPKATGVWRLALPLLEDERDLPFVKLALLLSLIALPFAALMFFGGLSVGTRFLLSVPYYGLLLGWYGGPYNLMLHNTSHRRLMKWRPLNHYIPNVLGFFFGHSANTYFAHHVGMHHPENNLRDDLSSTLDYQRDSFIDFLKYFARFFFLIVIELPLYFKRKGRTRLLRQVLFGELSLYAGLTALLFVDWSATVIVFVIPFVMMRFMMMAGNWGQHAFVDVRTPENCYRNSLTCINATYNRRCFNDGYHIGHHLKATRHWTEMPKDFRDNVQSYASEDAIVFHGIDFFVVWLFLMLGRYDLLARRVVSLDGKARSEAEIIAWLKTRTRAASSTEAELAAA
ncbi:MAG: fatty acid desaturase [Deltaproteobacteria bacterium]|nr:fatty acid desaturase [Deltaproteobacteria bacterium]